MKNNLIYRKCQLSDLEILTNISRQTFIDAFEKDNNPEDFKTYIDAAFNKKQIESELKNPDSEFYLVYSEDTLIGYFKTNQNIAQAENFGEHTLELSRIYLVTDFQGKNLGTQILQKIIDMAKDQRKQQLWLGVWQLNENAVRFYERHGFVKFDTHSFYIGNDRQIDWLMRLNLV